MEPSRRERQHLITPPKRSFQRFKDHGWQLEFLHRQRRGFPKVAIEEGINIIGCLEERLHRLLGMNAMAGTGV